MAENKLILSGGRWLYEVGGTNKILRTSGKFLDKDIEIRTQGGILSNAPRDGIAYTELNGPIVPAEGYLYINAGFYDNQKLSLGTILEDFENAPVATNGALLEGVKSYDQDGNLLVGTIKTLEPSTDYFTDDAESGIIGSKLESGFIDKDYYVKEGSVSTGTPTLITDTASQVITINTVNASNGITVTEVSEKPTTGRYITITNKATTAPTEKTVQVVTEVTSTEGWINDFSGIKQTATETITLAGTTEEDTKYFTVADAEVTLKSDSIDSATPTIEAVASTKTNAVQVTIVTSVDEVDDDDYFIAIEPKVAGSAYTPEVASVTEGYIDKVSQVKISGISINGATGQTHYAKIAAANFSGGVNEDKTAYEINATAGYTATKAVASISVYQGEFDNID